MISLVIVSHSAILAAGIKELADQMAQGKVPIATAAGLIDDADLLGTDPLMIENAIDSVYSDAGVLVLVDIGSAVMNAQMAIEQLPAHQQANVLLCEAPLAEGAIAAAAQGMAGSLIHCQRNPAARQACARSCGNIQPPSTRASISSATRSSYASRLV